MQPLAKSGRWPSLGGLPLHLFRYKSAAGSPGVAEGARLIGLAARDAHLTMVAAQKLVGAKGTVGPGGANLIHWGQGRRRFTCGPFGLAVLQVEGVFVVDK